MTFTESNTVEAYLRDLLCGPNADQQPPDPQQAIDICGLGPAGAGWTYLPPAAVPHEPLEIFSEPLVRALLIRLNPDIAAQTATADKIPSFGTTKGAEHAKGWPLLFAPFAYFVVPQASLANGYSNSSPASGSRSGLAASHASKSTQADRSSSSRACSSVSVSSGERSPPLAVTND